MATEEAKKLMGKLKAERKILEENTIRTSFFENGNFLFEQYKDKDKQGFIKYNIDTDTIEKVDEFVDENGFIHKCLQGEEIDIGAISLPSDIGEYVNDEKLDNDIKSFIGKWLDIDEDHLRYAGWCIKQSWVYDKLNTINYLRALGDTGCGKTRYLNTLGLLHYKPIQTGGASTSAPIFRIIDKWKGTMLIDECDLNKSDETAEIIKIINLGFEKGKFIMRCDKDKPEDVKFFDPYCPKLLATRKPFVDKATESRCFTKVMEETERKDIPFILTNEFFKEARELRNKLLLWRFRNYNKIDLDMISKVDLGDLEPRVKQAHIGFLPLFATDEKQLEFFKNYLQEYQKELIQERADSIEGRIIEVILKFIVEDGIFDFDVKDIIVKGEFKAKDGNYWHSRALTRYLKSLGLGKRQPPKKTDGKTKRCIFYTKEQILKLTKRYGLIVQDVDLDVVLSDVNVETQQKIEVEDVK